MWILTNSSSSGKPLLITLQSEKEHFARGIVTYDDTKTLNEVNVYKLVKAFAKQEGIEESSVSLLQFNNNNTFILDAGL